MTTENLDAVVVGAGFSGIYQIWKLEQIGLTNSVVIDRAGGVGGTWYHNVYPGAMSDTESFVYRYSWDKDDLKTCPMKDTYIKQPEVLAYLEGVTERHNLRKYMRFNTEVQAAEWHNEDQRWHITVNDNEKMTARYLITGLGLLSTTNCPDIPGIDTFKGDICHSAKWPKDYSLEGKRVGVLGCGSSGVQIITNIGDKVKSLTCFQRHPQYSVPSGDKPITPEYRAWLNHNWDNIQQSLRNSVVAFGFEESHVSYHSVDAAERERIFQDAWDKGNGFRFMFGTFMDITTDVEANEGACDFIRRKIAQIVKDPEKARKLQPRDLYARRPLCDGNARNGARYFEQFNRENVDIVLLGETPIERMEEEGVRTSDGKLHELDLLILATGFDAVEGSYNRIAIKGRNGLTLKESWEPEGPKSYLGVSVPEFPNLFMIEGPKGPFANLPVAIEVGVEFITDAIARAEQSGHPRPVEATHDAQKEYVALCEKLAANSLFWQTANNWLFGANIPGKKRCLRFYFGGLKHYREHLAYVVDHGYVGFKPFV